MALDILVVDDEPDIRELIAGVLGDEGYSVRTADTAERALEEVRVRTPRLVVLDVWLQGSGMDGLSLLKYLKSIDPLLPVIVISGHGNIETAVSAIRRGAYDYIEKPFKADRLLLIAQRALEASSLKREVQDLRARTGAETRLIGNSVAINQLRAATEKVAPTNSRVMITGPSGSGKELTARTLHALSNRSSGPFVALNAAAMEPERMELELFGTEENAGRQRLVGALEAAHGGTLYIDEVADMPRETQAKILRVLVEQKFQRVGGSAMVHVDVRIISSSCRDLEAEIAQGSLREDLFHRLSVVPLRVPGLAERRDDIPELVDYFIGQISRTTGLPARRIGDDAMAVIQAHDWPGNVRQLRNNVERLLILAGGDSESVISADMLPAEVGATLPPSPTGVGAEKLMALPLRDAREIFEREYLMAQINRFGGNISKTAEFVGMERSALHRKLKMLGVGGSERALEAG